MRPRRQRVARVARLRVAAVLGAGDLRGVEGHRLLHHRRAAVVDVAGCAGAEALRQIVVAGDLLHGRVRAVDRDAYRHQQRATPRAVLAGVKTLASQGVGDMHSPIAMCRTAIQRGRNWAAIGQVLPIECNHPSVTVKVGSKATACSAA